MYEMNMVSIFVGNHLHFGKDNNAIREGQQQNLQPIKMLDKQDQIFLSLTAFSGVKDFRYAMTLKLDLNSGIRYEPRFNFIFWGVYKRPLR